MKNRIYIKHWLALKPQNYSGNTDLYYLKVANNLHSNFDSSTNIMLSQFLSKDDLALFCCFLTSYFEDVISQTNVWQAFKSMYQEIYDKKLPFYSVDTNYVDDEINFEDISFLTWYFLNTIQDTQFISPHNQFILNVSETAMQVFENEYEYAPENKKLRQLFTLENKDDDFYTSRAFMQLIIFDSYLFNTDMKFRLDYSILNVIEETKGEDPESILACIREITEDHTFNKASALLALKAKDWASGVAGKSHPQYKSLNTISEKVTGIFLYKRQNEEVVLLEHIASGMTFEMTKKSFDHYENLEEDEILYLGLVKWKGEWWFSGNFTVSDFDADIILDEKNSIEARAQVNFLYDTKEVDNIFKAQEKAFLKFNNGTLIAFLKAQEVEAFVLKFMDFYNKDLNLSSKEVNEAKQRTKGDGYFGNENEFEDFNSEERTVVFFNPKNGLEFYFDISNAFPDKNNLFFTHESHEDVMHILIDPDCSVEFVHYFIDHYKNQLTFFETEPYASYLNDLDFLLRFWKKENYKTNSTLVLTGKKEQL